MIVVVDTSVLLSALMKQRGFTNQLLQRAARQRYVLCRSRAIEIECIEKAQAAGLEPTEIDDFMATLDDWSIIGDDSPYLGSSVAADDHVVGCYHATGANLVLTSDKALIRRLKQLDIPAIRPSEFQAYLS